MTQNSDTKKIREIIENLPDELELAEDQWYEYQYNKKRNLFILQQILDIPRKTRMICVEEPGESYISSILRAFGYEVYQSMPSDTMNGSSGIAEDMAGTEKKYDAILLLNVIELSREHPALFLRKRTSLLKDDGRMFITTENISQFRNRLKLLLGRSIYLQRDSREPRSFRKFGVSELMMICANSHLRVIKWDFLSPFPPYRIEALTLLLYLLKYFNYFVMKVVPSFRDTIHIEAALDKAY
jgi:hypothetical protein